MLIVMLFYHNWTRVDEGRKCGIVLAIKMKARTVEGRRESARYVTPDLSYYWEGAREQCEDHKWDGIYIL